MCPSFVSYHIFSNSADTYQPSWCLKITKKSHVQVLKNSPNLIFFSELLPNQKVNVARYARNAE